MFSKKCPKCNNEQFYKNKRGFQNAVKHNSLCYSCSNFLINKGRKLTEEHKKKISNASKGVNNGFYGKKHSKEVCEKLSKQHIGLHHTEESKKLISKSTSGENNPMYGRSFYDIWLEKYGKEEADKRLIAFKEKISKATSGKNNPMYCKPSPQGSGNGWSGWYKDFYFRSLHELKFLITCERFKLQLKSAESKEYRIKYIDFDDSVRNYFADYIVNDKWLVEIKPKKLWSTPKNKAKFEAAKKWCSENDLKFKLIDFGKMNESNIIELYNKKLIKFTKLYEEKFKEKFNIS